MSKSALLEIGIGAAMVGLAFIPALGPGLVLALLGSGFSMAVGGVVSGITSLTTHTGGVSGATRNPIAAHNYQFGRCVVAGTTVFQEANSDTGGGSTSNNKQLHLVRVLNAHPSEIGTFGTGTSSDWQLYVAGKVCPMAVHGTGYLSVSPTQHQIAITSISRLGGLVTFHTATGISGLDGQTCYVKNVADHTFNQICIITQPDPSDDTTFQYICGGADTTSSGGVLGTAFADFGGKVYVEFLDGNHTSTFPTLLESGTTWGETDLWLGRTVMYIQLGYSAEDFGAVPDIRLVCRGANMIYDPRTSTYGYTNNAALCVAYYLNLPRQDGGFGLQYGTDINTAQLIAAANICDEAVSLAAGGTVPRYTCDGSIQVTRGRGSILEELLSSCAGRISYSGGQYSIFPGAWVAPTASFSTADFVGPVEIKPLMSSRDIANGAKGVYTSPENNWAEADVPSYTQDTVHGYSTNQYLTQDNNVAMYLTQNLPFTTNAACAQRLLKIAMMRLRFQQRVTVRLSMKAFQCTPLDVITITHPKYGWSNTTFEVLSANIVNETSEENPRIYMQLDLALTDSSVYDWSTSEELSVTGYKQPDLRGGTATTAEPNSLTVYSGPGATIGGVTYPSTIISTASGINRNSLLVNWIQPNDDFVTGSGHIEIQYQLSGASSWTDGGKVSGNATSFTINGVTEGSTYNVQIRSVNMVGVPSDWVTAAPITISDTTSSIASTIITGLDPTAMGGDLPAGRITGSLPVTQISGLASVATTGILAATDISGTIANTSLPTPLAHLSSQGASTPSVAAGANPQVGTGASASVSGSGLSGTITLTTGTGTLAAGDLCTVTFSPAASSAPHGVVAASGTAIAGLQWTTATSTLTVSTATALAPSTTYTLGYFLA